MNTEGRRGIGRPKKKWSDAIGCDMRTAVVCVEDMRNHVERRFKTGGRP